MQQAFGWMNRACALFAAISMVLGVVSGSHAQQEQTAPTMEDYQQAMEAGAKALAEGEYEAAADAFSVAIRINTFSPEPYAGRAQALAGLEEYDAADKDFAEALTKQAEHVPSLVGRGEMRLKLNANDLAMGDFQLALEQDRSNLRALFGLGKAYILLGGGEQGVKPLTRFLEKAPEEDPENKKAEAFRLRAQGFAAVGKYPDALQDIQQSLSLKPDDYETYAVLGTIFLRQEEYINAVRALTDAVARYVPDPEAPQPYIQGYLTKASVFIEIGKRAEDIETKRLAYNAAVAECDLLLGQIGDQPQFAQAEAATLYSRGVALRMEGRFGEAIEDLSRAIELNPELGEAYFRRGICFHNIGEEKLAIADFQQAANVNIEDPRARLWEGFAYANLGDYHNAVRAYGQAIAESDRYTPAYVNRGLAYMSLAEYDKAVNNFNEAIRIEPASAEHYFKRGVAYERMGEYQKAADSFANAIEFNDKHAAAHRHMADAMTSLGRQELADQYRQRAEQLSDETSGL